MAAEYPAVAGNNPLWLDSRPGTAPAFGDRAFVEARHRTPLPTFITLLRSVDPASWRE